MILKFKYHHAVEYYLKTYSSIVIDGNGEWDVDEIDLAEEFIDSEYEFSDFLAEYFYMTLNIEESDIDFDPTDLKTLQNFCEQYKKKKI